MSRYGAAIPTWTTGTGVADATQIPDGNYHDIQSGGASQRNEVREIYIGGQATSAAAALFVFGRLTTLCTSLTATRLAALDAQASPQTTGPTAFGTCGTSKPSRNTTSGCLLNLSMNLFGGIVRWYAGPDEVISFHSLTAPNADISLNLFTGSTSGSVGTNIVFEQI